MSTEVLQADLPVSDGTARVVIDGALSSLEWRGVLRIATPNVLEPAGIRSVLGDDVRYDFPVRRSLIGKPYEFDVYAEGDQRVTIARGVLVAGTGVLTAPLSLAELELPAQPGVYVHEQNAAATTWTIAHGLGYEANVTIIDSSGREVVGDVTYIDDDTIQLDFSSAFGGRAIIGG